MVKLYIYKLAPKEEGLQAAASGPSVAQLLGLGTETRLGQGSVLPSAGGLGTVPLSSALLGPASVDAQPHFQKHFSPFQL